MVSLKTRLAPGTNLEPSPSADPKKDSYRDRQRRRKASTPLRLIHALAQIAPDSRLHRLNSVANRYLSIEDLVRCEKETRRSLL